MSRRPGPLAVLACALLLSVVGARAQAPVRRRAPPAPELVAEPRVPPYSSAAPSSPPARLALTGLPRRFDAAPSCRAQCAAVRNVCDAAEGETCAAAWALCTPRCRATP